jgi:GTP-binding protein
LKDQLPEVAFAGRSNVGKSSLLNRLLGRKALARISSKPGRTRSINYFLINERCYFVDLPGYGYAKAAKSERREWAKLMEAYLERAGRDGRTRVIQLVDAKVGATPLDVQAHEYITHQGCEPTVVATKVDRIPRGRRPAALAGICRSLGVERERVLPVSARSGEGTRELWREIDSHVESKDQGREERGAR